MHLGDAIKKARKDKGLTQKQLAEHVGVAEITIRQYEAGKREPKLEQLQKIAGALNLEINILHLPEIDKPNPIQIASAPNDGKTPHADRLRKIREEKGMSQEELAEKSGVSLATIIAIENNEKKMTMGASIRLSKALGVSIVDFEDEGFAESVMDIAKKFQEQIAFAKKISAFCEEHGISIDDLDKLMESGDPDE